MSTLAREQSTADVEHLMIPGPCRLDPDEQEVLGRPIQPHYGQRWVPRFRRVLDDLGGILGARHTYLLPGSGSAGLDAALFNLFEPGQRVVVVDSGYFGSRLVAMARAHRLEVRVAPCVPGRRSCRPPTWYFDLARWDRAVEECPGLEPTPVTMPTSLVEVLGSSVSRIGSVGIGSWLDRREWLAGKCRTGLRRLGLRVVADDEWAANLVVVVADERADTIRAQLGANAGIMLGGGMTPFEDNVFRVGLVGRAGTDSMVTMLLDEIREVLR